MMILTVLCALIILPAKLLAGYGIVTDGWPFPFNTVNTPDCQLPCWHGIRPGLTTAQDAKIILDSDPSFDRVTSPRMIELENTTEWRWLTTPTENNSVILDYNSDSRQQVVAIRLYGTATPGHIIAALGSPPRAIIAGLCFGQSALFYNDSYVVYVVSDHSYFDPPPFQPDTAAKIFVYLTPPDPLRRPSNPDLWRGFRAKLTPFDGELACD